MSSVVTTSSWIVIIQADRSASVTPSGSKAGSPVGVANAWCNSPIRVPSVRAWTIYNACGSSFDGVVAVSADCSPRLRKRSR
jgi:hypothetical protein